MSDNCASIANFIGKLKSWKCSNCKSETTIPIHETEHKCIHCGHLMKEEIEGKQG